MRPADPAAKFEDYVRQSLDVSDQEMVRQVAVSPLEVMDMVVRAKAEWPAVLAVVCPVLVDMVVQAVVQAVMVALVEQVGWWSGCAGGEAEKPKKYLAAGYDKGFVPGMLTNQRFGFLGLQPRKEETQHGERRFAGDRRHSLGTPRRTRKELLRIVPGCQGIHARS